MMKRSTRAGLFSLLVAPISVHANLQIIYGVYQDNILPYKFFLQYLKARLNPFGIQWLN
jgi:hypothetical protein